MESSNPFNGIESGAFSSTATNWKVLVENPFNGIERHGVVTPIKSRLGWESVQWN